MLGICFCIVLLNNINRREKQMNNPGYVYVLINPSLEGMVKIGKTTREPADRASELSSATGVPTAFVVAYDEYFPDASIAEEYVHTLLEHKGYRLTKNREFFTVPIKEVVLALQQAKDELGGSQSIEESKLPDSGHDEIIKELLELAGKYNYGRDDYLEDKDKALELYTKALKLGHYESYYSCGSIYLNHKKNRTKALDLFKKGTEKIENRVSRADCFENMAEIYETEGHTRNALKCWDKFFSMVNIEEAQHHLMEDPDLWDDGIERIYVPIESVFQYIETARKENTRPKYKDVLTERLEAEYYVNRKDREDELEKSTSSGSGTTMSTSVHLLLYHTYIEAIENDDYSDVDEYFPDEGWREVDSLIEIDGEVFKL